MFRSDAATGAGCPAPAPGHSDGGNKADAAAPAALLDRYEGIDNPRGCGCGRWPEHLALVSSHGQVVKGRCKATNLCRYCQLLYVLETVEMLLLDAAEHAPSLWVVLTAREHLTRAQCRRHLDVLLRACRRRWPATEWFVQVEFQRRGALHLNLLIKGVPTDSAPALLELLSERWCARVDALAAGQWIGNVNDAGGIAKYLAKTLSHGLKAEQAPPLGWRGHRTSQTRGYLVRPASVMREEARESMWLKRQLWKAGQLGLSGDEAEDWVDQQLAIEGLPEWGLCGLKMPEVDRNKGQAAVPWFMVIAAFEWQAEQEAINEARLAKSETHSPPGADARGDDRPPPSLPGLRAGAAQASGAGSPP